MTEGTGVGGATVQHDPIQIQSKPNSDPRAHKAVVEPLRDSVIWTVTNILISFHGNYNIQESIVSEWTLDQTVRVKQYMCIEYWLWEGLSINFAYWKHGQSDKGETILDVSIMDDVRTVKQVSDWNHGVDDYIRSMN